jgi:hypothetical protein
MRTQQNSSRSLALSLTLCPRGAACAVAFAFGRCIGSKQPPQQGRPGAVRGVGRDIDRFGPL